MMVGEDEELGEGDPRAVEEWPPPNSVEVTNKDGSSSRLLFLTVQYVGDEAGTSFNTEVQNVAERVVSPLDPNMGCTACYSPVYGHDTPTQLQEQSMIVLAEPDNYIMPGDEGKLLLLADPLQSSQIEVGGEQKVELLLSNGSVVYGIVEAADTNGTRIIQIPREYLIAARPQHTEMVDHNVNRQTTNEENTQLSALYNTYKDQGFMIIDSRDLQVGTEEPLVDSSLLHNTTLVTENSSTTPQPQHRFWCEECNMLLETVCREHQINRKISDKPVPSRARATLPASYLSINLIADSEYAVFARKTIPKRTQFGPMEGVAIKIEDVSFIHEGPHLELTVETEAGELTMLDVSNEHMSNWMRFVRPATPERHPNLLVSQIGASLFFTSTCSIHAKEELVVWYSPVYALRRNLPDKPPPPVWPCIACGQELNNHQELMRHSTLHIKQSQREENLTVTSLKRRNQEVVATVNKDFTDRNLQGTVKSRFECVVCKKRFPKSYSLKRHILLLHTRENKYYCKACHLGFSHSYNRLKHMRKAHPSVNQSGIKPPGHRYESWSCSHCKLTFSSASILNLHTLVHAANNVENSSSLKSHDLVSCPQCSQSFRNNEALANHVSEHGKNKDPLDKKFHCDVCGRNFISAVRFEVHKESHRDDDKKPLQCHVCMKRLLTESALTCHLKIHDCNAQWECPMCKQNYSNLLALKMHVRTHADNGLYYCPHCQKKFEEYSGIRKHIRAFHSSRSHRCEACGKSFPSQDKLRMHLLRHSDWREFLCADCGKQFKRKDKLKEHMKRIHSSAADSQHSLTRGPQKNQSSLENKEAFSKAMNTSDYERYIYKCHSCVLGFKRRGMLVNHLANRHPDITPESVPELNLPILKTTRDYYCQYCDKIYKSSSKRKAHILKNHPGLELPMSSRQKGGVPDIPGLPNPTFSQTVGSVTTNPHGCQWCHKQYASKAKLIQHQQKKHLHLLPHSKQMTKSVKNTEPEDMHDAVVDVEDPIPIALSTNINHQIMLSAASLSQLQEFEIVTTDYECGGSGILIDSSTNVRKSNKLENISSDLLSQAMSEIGVSLSDLKAEQYLKLLQDPLYVPYPAR